MDTSKAWTLERQVWFGSILQIQTGWEDSNLLLAQTPWLKATLLRKEKASPGSLKTKQNKSQPAEPPEPSSFMGSLHTSWFSGAALSLNTSIISHVRSGLRHFETGYDRLMSFSCFPFKIMARWRAEEESALHPSNWGNSLIKSNFVRLVCLQLFWPDYCYSTYIYIT